MTGTYREIQRAATRRLQSAGCESVHFTVMNLMTHCFGLERSDLILNSAGHPERDKSDRFWDAVERCANGEPLQYILGAWEFMGLPFLVGEGVLIPRPETELLVDQALRVLRELKKPPVVFDLCTGSGAVAVSIAHFVRDSRIFALEKSEEALNYAKRNVSLNHAGNVRLIQCDVLDGPGGLGLPQPDLIVSNPPYIATDALPTLQREVQREPCMALDGGGDGLLFYRAILRHWAPALVGHGALLLEIGEDQGAAVLSLFGGSFPQAEILPDYSGKDRVFLGKL